MQATLSTTDQQPLVDTDRRAMTTSEIFDSKSVAPLWTTKDLAKFLGCSERQIPRLRDEGLPAVRVGGLVRFIPSRVMSWLSECDSRVTNKGPHDERSRQLADITATGDDDNVECAAADLFREFSPAP
jgi:excisionase family DNA binding protein